MSFFSTEQAKTGNNFEQGGGDIEPIPHNTRCNAMIEEIKWTEYMGDRYINVRWTILDPTEYKNRKVFQKLRVLDSDDKKSDKAKRMLAAIDANSGGAIVALGREPSDNDLMLNLLNKPMQIQVMVWKMTGDDGAERTGNWVNAVSGTGQTPQQPPSAPQGIDDQIPFN